MNVSALRSTISQAIEENDYSILEVEKKAGIPRDTLRNFLTGRVKEPKIDTIKAVSRLLNIDLQTYFHEATTQQEKCNLELFEKCFTCVIRYATHHNKDLSFDDVVCLVKKIYIYHKDYSPEIISESFIAWCMDQEKV